MALTVLSPLPNRRDSAASTGRAQGMAESWKSLLAAPSCARPSIRLVRSDVRLDEIHALNSDTHPGGAM